MLFTRIKKFIKKPFAQKVVSLRFHLKRALAKIPYLVVPVWLYPTPDEKIRFWWSYLAPEFDPDKRMFDYVGADIRELHFLCRILKPGMCFIDIGAFHGIYSVIAAKKLKDTGRIIAFEPSLREIRRIKCHIFLNSLSNILVEPCAVSFQKGRAKFFIVLAGLTAWQGINSLRYPSTRIPVKVSIKEVEVNTITLDDYCNQKKIGQIDVLKIDTEGAEREVLRGAANVIVTSRPLIICEVLDSTTKNWGYAGRDIITYMQERDYKWFEFQNDGMLIAHTITDKYPNLDLSQYNYLAVPKEKLFLVENLIRQ